MGYRRLPRTGTLGNDEGDANVNARETAKEKMVVALQPEQAPVADDEHHQFCIRYQRAVRQLQSA